MPSVRTADYLIDRVRNRVQVLDKARLQDGYPSEKGIYPDGPRILEELNWALNLFTGTGFNKCRFTLEVKALETNYPMPRAAHSISSAWVEDAAGKTYDITKTSMEELEEEWRSQGWRTLKSNRIRRFYTIGTKAFCVWPTPTLDGLKVKYYANTVVEDMTLPTDVPAVMRDSTGAIMLDSDGKPMSALPEEYHEHLVEVAMIPVLRKLGRRDEANEIAIEVFGGGDVRGGLGGIIFNLKKLAEDRKVPDVMHIQLDITGGDLVRDGAR